MDLAHLTDRERLIAEQAVETLRALDRAADAAPHGHGWACIEAAVHERGFDLLRAMMTATAGARPEAQKKGPASGRARAAAARRSRPATRGRS